MLRAYVGFVAGIAGFASGLYLAAIADNGLWLMMLEVS